MRRKRLATLWWPGLSEIWVSGRSWGLGVAFAAAGLLNLALLGSFAWIEPFSPAWRIGLWSAVAVGWGGWALLAAIAEARCSADRDHQPLTEDTFAEAQEHYLKGHYLQAELVLVDLLRRNRRDVQARLMLATLLRRGGRIDEAVKQLAELARHEDAEPWQAEIDGEREAIRRVKKADADEHGQASEEKYEEVKENDKPITEPETDSLKHQPEPTQADEQRGARRPAA